MDKIASIIDKISNKESSLNNSSGSGFVPLVAGGFVIGIISGVILIKCIKKSAYMVPKSKISP
jgi:hypothetical protein